MPSTISIVHPPPAATATNPAVPGDIAPDPTRTPARDDAPVATTEAIPDALVAALDGTGEGATAPFALAPGLVLFHIFHTGKTPFAAFLMSEQGDHLALLANATTPISGTRAFGILAGGVHYIHVIATDGWEATVTQPAVGSLPITAAPAALHGTGLAALGPFTVPAATTTIRWTHTGSVPFNLTLLDASGTRLATIAEEATAHSGERSVPSPSGGAVLFDVGADGPWSITLSH